jgi:hypothetical protein
MSPADFLEAFVQQLIKPNFSFGISLCPHGSERLLASAHLSVRMDQSDNHREDFFKFNICELY